ncbi:IS110 family transposase [Streptomyces sp. ME01-18a]|uniref:IS110 family transposase n=1 Tax=Streptomyces sp. ME01-18a TaxID=3028669 RepID=UPI0039F72074
MDWAEGHHDIALVDAGGKQLAKVRISDDAAGFAQLMALLAEHGDSEDAQIPAARRGLLVACLQASGRPVFAINPLAVVRYRVVPLQVGQAEEMATALSDPGLHTFIGGTPDTAQNLDYHRRRPRSRCEESGQGSGGGAGRECIL